MGQRGHRESMCAHNVHRKEGHEARGMGRKKRDGMDDRSSEGKSVIRSFIRNQVKIGGARRRILMKSQNGGGASILL